MNWFWKSSSSVTPQQDITIVGKEWNELTPQQQLEYKKDVLRGMFRDVNSFKTYNYALMTKQGDLRKWKPFVKENELEYYKRVGFYLVNPPSPDIVAEWCEEVFDFPFTLHRCDGVLWARRVYGFQRSTPRLNNGSKADKTSLGTRDE